MSKWYSTKVKKKLREQGKNTHKSRLQKQCKAVSILPPKTDIDTAY